MLSVRIGLNDGKQPAQKAGSIIYMSTSGQLQPPRFETLK
jgi:hypothetical protein